ncbi:hypothetical protein EYF80_064371 [Liparis tanakae]|uniref:Uncharacterized protein n=1 Tax=Liparis tanakae TaxID=230148 RepID=A0A4Z2E9K9_9TELE|nr:hypothetical protein EYF80_064371 [Liparis tanakae]
MLTADGWDL